MARKNKFQKGEPYTSLDDVVKAIDRQEWVYWHDRPMHFGWLQNMSLMTVRGAIRYRQLARAQRVGGVMVCKHSAYCSVRLEGHCKPHEFIAGECETPWRCPLTGWTVLCAPANSPSIAPACIGGD